MLLSVIIINYNVKYFLEHCLLSVIKACKEIEVEILVADNNSSDGSREYLEPKFPTVKFFWNNENTGFAKANNSMLSQAKGEHILFLNPDTIVPEDCFLKCLSFFDSHNDCGALGVRMIDGSGNFLKESKRSLPTPSSGFFKMTGLETLFPNSSIFAGYYAGHLPEKENRKAEILSGAFMMLSRKVADITKGFDENFFMYGEDIDLSYRILKSGFQNYYLGEITIIHFKGESTQKDSAAYLNNFYGSVKLFIDKHYTNQKLYRALMSLTIQAGKKIASLKNKRTSDKKPQTVRTGISTLITGTDVQKQSIVQILSNSNYIISEAGTERIDSGQFLKMIRERNTEALVLAENEHQSFRKIIQITAEIKGSCRVLFFNSDASAIIGSADKNATGVVITITC